MATEIIWHQKQFLEMLSNIFWSMKAKKQNAGPNLTVCVGSSTSQHQQWDFCIFSDALALDAGKHFKLNGKIVAQYALC